MITLIVDEKTREDLRELYNARVVQLGNSLRTWAKYSSANKRNTIRAAFDRAVDFLHSLNAATDQPHIPTLPADHPRNGSALVLAGNFDPRAEHPRCVHGVLFDDPCERCDSVVANTPPLTSTTQQ